MAKVAIFKYGANTDTPCAGCGDAEQWLEDETELCWACRNGGDVETMKGDALVKVIEGELVGPSAHPATGEIEAYLELGRALEVDCQEDLDTVAEGISTLKAMATALEAEEKRATAPMNAALKVVRGWFSPAKKGLQDARALFDAAYLAGREKLRLRAAQKAREVQERIAANDSAGAALAHRQVTPPAPTAGARVSKVWAFRVVNPDLVPELFKVVDEAKVRAHMRAELAAAPNQTPVLPGVIFEQVEQVSAVKS